MYTPDRWVMLKIASPEIIVYKILAGWGGGYLYGQSWKLNSGVTKVEVDGDYFLFHGASGSIYKCHKGEGSYGLMSITSGVYDTLMYKVETENDSGITIELLPETTDFMSIDYGE